MKNVLLISPGNGNGGIRSCFDAKRVLDESGCDAVMIGRGVLGNPWLIRDCVNYLEYGIEPKDVSFEEKIAMLKKHADYLFLDKPERVALLEMRTHAAYYVKGLPGCVEIKTKIFQTNTREELYKLLEDYLNKNKEKVSEN